MDNDSFIAQHLAKVTSLTFNKSLLQEIVKPAEWWQEMGVEYLENGETATLYRYANHWVFVVINPDRLFLLQQHTKNCDSDCEDCEFNFQPV